MAGMLAGKRVLIVEDEYFIAFDLKRALAQQDAIVVGPVAELDRGLALAGDEALDAAVLDVNLEDGMTFPIAAALADRAVPYMFLTGYDGWSLPEEYRSAPRLAKPFAMRAVLGCIEQLIAREVA